MKTTIVRDADQHPGQHVMVAAHAARFLEKPGRGCKQQRCAFLDGFFDFEMSETRFGRSRDWRSPWSARTFEHLYERRGSPISAPNPKRLAHFRPDD